VHSPRQNIGTEVLLTIVAVTLAVMNVSSTRAATNTTAGSAGLLNDWLRQQCEPMRMWDFGGEFRVRYANYQNAVAPAGTMTKVPAGAKPLTMPVNPNTDFIACGQVSSTDMLLTREKLHAGYTPVSWLTMYGELRNCTDEWDRRSPRPDANLGKLYQTYISLGDSTRFPLIAKIGRQEMAYGDQRFIGNPDWINVGRTFDAVKLRLTKDCFWADAFVARVVVPYQNHFDENNRYDTVSGILLASQKLVPWQETQCFIFSRNVGAEAASASAFDVPGAPATARDIFTFGFRFKSLPGKLAGWDYSLEAAGQLGRIYNSTLKKRLDQQAYTIFTTAGYTWTNLWATPRLGIAYDVGSGDGDPNDGKNGTFDNLFGNTHARYSLLDLVCQRNMHITRLSLSLQPLKQLSLTADYRLYWLYSTEDYFYPLSGSGRCNNGYGIHPSYSSFVGSELALTASYSLTSWWILQTGYGHFFVGDYIKESVSSVPANGGAVDANFFFLQTKFTF